MPDEPAYLSHTEQVRSCTISSFKGSIKVKIGGTIPAGSGFTAKDGKIVKIGTSGAYSEVGFLRANSTTADGDTALVCWG